MSFWRSAAATAAAEASRMTVRMVPSTGFATAPYAARDPESSAFARSRPLNVRLPLRPSAIPRRIWLVITPELPRAPMSAPNDAAAATRSAGASAPTPSASMRAARTVASMFVPVSPSGTGNTFRALISSTSPRGSRRRPERPPGGPRRHRPDGPSGHVRAAVGEVAATDVR